MARAKTTRTTGEQAAETVGKNLKKLQDLRKDTARLSVAFLHAYENLWSSPAIRGDAAARALMLRIARARKIGQLETLVASLSQRVDELLGAGPRRRGPARTMVGTKYRRLDVVAAESDESADDLAQRLFLVL